ncbi:hypothetical protein ADM90_01380 [Lysinibacillus macroides]|uniref:Uncharacterized protein n=1 Tax=Lysinibacillus macroides TaxID=33935 RepID=A0A0M9DN98_9BACI|nr:hypothetical protein ADM90_01380 [Lysinibacillus macroides]
MNTLIEAEGLTASECLEKIAKVDRAYQILMLSRKTGEVIFFIPTGDHVVVMGRLKGIFVSLIQSLLLLKNLPK